MTNLDTPLISKNGLRGKLLDSPKSLDSDSEIRILFESGREVQVPTEHLTRKGDGTYYLDLNVDPRPADGPYNIPAGQTVAAPESIVIPRVEEQAEISKVVRETGRVRVTRSVIETQVTIDEPTIYQEYKVVRVPINRVVDTTEPSREENGTTIIPVYEEEVVTSTRLILREEIHLVKTLRETHNPSTITLRKHSVDVERS